jgi:hypothetical protein
VKGIRITASILHRFSQSSQVGLLSSDYPATGKDIKSSSSFLHLIKANRLESKFTPAGRGFLLFPQGKPSYNRVRFSSSLATGLEVGW